MPIISHRSSCRRAACKAKTGSVGDELLRACGEESHDAGPYDFAGKTIDWDKVLQGDRLSR